MTFHSKSQGIFIPSLINGALLEVDFSKKEIHYPETQGLTVNNRKTCNFSENEKFVVLVLSLDEQKEFVAKVEALKKKIADAQTVIDTAPEKKQAVMQKHL